jgi:PAS domain S-box-containing protein
LKTKKLEDIIADFEKRERNYFATLMFLLGTPFLGYFMVKDLISGSYIPALFCIPILVLIGFVLPLIRRFSDTKEKEVQYFRFFYYVFLISAGIFIIYLIESEGYSRVPWFYLLPLLAFLMLGHRVGLILTATLFFLLIISNVLIPDTMPVIAQDLRLRFFVSIVLITIISYFLERWRDDYKNALINAITERKQAEKALWVSEEKYRNLIDKSDDIIWATDLDLRTIYVSPSIEKKLGFTPEERLAQDLTEQVTPSSYTHLTERLLLELKREQEGSANPDRVIRIEAEFNHKNGTTLWFENVISGLRDENGTLTGIQGISRDISDRKRAEKERMELEKKLVRSQKMESLGLLAGGVAHDLNNVLSGIVSFPELILLDLPEDSKLRKPIEIIQASGQRATAIVEDLLTVARGVAITKEPLNLNNVVRDYLSSPEFKQLERFHPTVKVENNLDKALLNINGSYFHIRKVVMNLVSNASEAVEDGGHVNISTLNRFVDRPIREYDDITKGEYALLTVSDNGSGISSDDLARIFEPFYTKKILGRSGTGLGLAVVWNVVQDHQGYINVTTDENGTTFELYFPITRDAIFDKEMSLLIKDFKGNQETILVVDDLESQRDISCMMLNTLGYNTKAVSSGEEAVEYLKENTVDLILLDMIMDPGINGRETYERIIKIHPHQKAIIVSGFAETDDVKGALKLGAGKYIKKPLTLERLGLAIKEELEK